MISSLQYFLNFSEINSFNLKLFYVLSTRALYKRNTKVAIFMHDGTFTSAYLIIINIIFYNMSSLYLLKFVLD